jgi:hypothetical protein
MITSCGPKPSLMQKGEDETDPDSSSRWTPRAGADIHTPKQTHTRTDTHTLCQFFFKSMSHLTRDRFSLVNKK